jgi:hypothetical protein
VTRDLSFSGIIRRTAPVSRLLRHTRGCGGSILTQILTGLDDDNDDSDDDGIDYFDGDYVYVLMTGKNLYRNNDSRKKHCALFNALLDNISIMDTSPLLEKTAKSIPIFDVYDRRA